MPIGSMYSRISRNWLSALILRHMGAFDLHTHIRLKPILSFFRDRALSRPHWQILEVGCGDGINAFELLRLAQRKQVSFHYHGTDIDSQALARARDLARELDVEGSLSFSQVSAKDIATLSMQSPDIVILADVLEHMADPEAFLKELKPMLHDDSVCLISVPTHNYKRFFGRSFHRTVGHVTDGYHIRELNALLATIGGRLICHSYSTGLLSNLGCGVYYRIPKNRYVTPVKALLLSPFRVLDFYNGPRVSCSLFGAYGFQH
jgi:2-polyprenyl-3-methyl-5-hydroxy-6-metoxy-1,4-benzoquinol methylase